MGPSSVPFPTPLPRRACPLRSRWPQRMGTAVGLALLFAVAVPIDLPLTRWVASVKWPGSVREIFQLGEYFGHGLGVLLITITLFTLTPEVRRRLPRLLWSAFGAGGVANLLKLCVFRLRPCQLSLGGFDLQHVDFATTFNPPPELSALYDSPGFPSAHTATACGLAAVLCSFHPRGRILFWTLAGLCAMQRIWAQAHFLTDTLAGAAIGLLVAEIVLHSPVGRIGFDWFEQRPQPATPPPSQCARTQRAA